MNAIAYLREALSYIIICEPYHIHTVTFQDFCPLVVICNSSVIQMLASVKFDRQFRGGAIEINNETVNYLLPQKTDRVIPQK
jgi:hypothetical protein